MTTPLIAANNYINVCLGTFSEFELISLLDEDVILHHETNGVKIAPIKGRMLVASAFSENIFKNSKNFDVKSTGVSPKGNTAAVFIDVKEDKVFADGGYVRYHFIERTLLTFVKIGQSWKISAIDMKVTRSTT